MNIGEMQKKLSLWAQENPTEHRRELYNLLCDMDWLKRAHLSVNSNQGRETAGTDGMRMSNFNADVEGNLQRLSKELQAKTFEPTPVRRVYIPKASGKKRPLGIPTIDDRIVQEALRMILEPIWEADFSKYSYGFRPNVSTYDAMTYIGKRLAAKGGESYQWIIEGDIASYFDTIPHRRLLKAVKQRVADRDIRDLIWKFLRAGVMYQGNVQETLTGTPQGGIVSPLLANIYLHQLDKYMETHYLNLPRWIRQQRRKKGIGNHLYVRYADDFLVLCNGTRVEALSMKEELKHVLDTLGLTLSEEKTRVTHITEGLDFLGYRIIRSLGTSGKMIPKVLIPDKAIKQFRHKLREMLAPSTYEHSVNAKILALNRLTQGWCEYYRSTNNPSKAFRMLDEELFWGMAHWLGRKYDTSIPTVMERFREGRTFGTKTRRLRMPGEYKAKRFIAKTWHNPYTETEKVAEEKDRIKREILFSYNIWTGYEHRHGGMDLREEVLLRDGPTCARCGETFHPFAVHVDHILARSRFKDPTEADNLENLQVLCPEHHKAKTKTDLKVLSRMR